MIESAIKWRCLANKRKSEFYIYFANALSDTFLHTKQIFAYGIYYKNFIIKILIVSLGLQENGG